MISLFIVYKMKDWKRIVYSDIVLERYKKIEKKNKS